LSSVPAKASALALTQSSNWNINDLHDSPDGALNWPSGDTFPSAALAANMLGAIVGGLLENLSLLFGIKALLLVALGVYLLAAGGLLGEARLRVEDHALHISPKA
jgi:hypothetical protein